MPKQQKKEFLKMRGAHNISEGYKEQYTFLPSCSRSIAARKIVYITPTTQFSFIMPFSNQYSTFYTHVEKFSNQSDIKNGILSSAIPSKLLINGRS